ncbi:MAG: phosphatidate cytidylyltransferase [Chloroflexi bacterium]|nr:phosphatidate cytidylyltransferase [Chloroflexota bacterium]
MADRSEFRENLYQRLATILIGLPLVISTILLSWWSTAVLMVIVIGLATLEYIHIIQQGPSVAWHDVGFGIIYLGLPVVSALWLRAQPEGSAWFLVTLAGNWTSDSAAYLFGSWLGHTPFMPHISPKKTWAGTIGGLVSGGLATLGLAALLGVFQTPAVWLLAGLLPVASIIGDLLESRLKRRFAVKDSGHLLPGHGGILDRIDGTLITLPVAALVVLLLV